MRRTPEFSRLADALQTRNGLRGEELPGAVFGVQEGAMMLLLCALGRQVIVVCEDGQSACRIRENLAELIPDAVTLPGKELSLTATYASREVTSERINALFALREGRTAVTTIEAAMQACCPPDAIDAAAFTLRPGMESDPAALAVTLVRNGYERVEKADGPGQFRLSGGILDIFAPSGLAVRAEYYGDAIDTLRSYDPQTQRSIETLEQARILPASETPASAEALERAKARLRKRKGVSQTMLSELEEGVFENADRLLPALYDPATLFDYAPGAVIALHEPNRLKEKALAVHERFAAYYADQLLEQRVVDFMAELLQPPIRAFERIAGGHTLLFSALPRAFPLISPRSMFKFDSACPQYSAHLDALAHDIAQAKKAGYALVITAGQRAAQLAAHLADGGVEVARAETLLREPVHGEVIITEDRLPCGAQFKELKYWLLGEADIYGVQKRAAVPRRRQSAGRLDLFAELREGDYIVHDLHGIGIFKGLKKLPVDGREKDFLQIQYAGTDVLYVPAEQFDRVQKYIGAEGHAPRISKMGGADFARVVGKARQSVKELAFDLAALYAQRQEKRGFAFSDDSLWQGELEDAFPYEETRDQLICIDEIKKDMQSSRVMDRLLCGDVGYGKTEVAIRAAFKAVQDSKQVMFLVPTTILAQQHYQTLLQRFAGFPVRVEVLSRFKSAAGQRAVIAKIKEGAVDIVVGTHRLLGKDVQFKDLGLLIVDEEQRFGVGHKEQIKNLHKNVDVLSLSATPIPRTLHMSMMGIRDISIIETPPEERFPVQTYVAEYSDSVMAEAIRNETGRGGQVYVVYNHVRGMERFTASLREKLPGISFSFANGQLPETLLERTMMDFLDREVDVLVCSTIIESGLDLQNVNTIIIYDADRFGLSQLYQLRGRVGRSSRLGYAYLFFRPDKVLSEVAEKRLRAVREFTELGSGFKIAMRDLEIRGAGNLLGPEQHGHMAEVGYDYYCRLVEQAMREVKGEQLPPQVDTQLSIPIEAYLPEDYVKPALRLEVYRRIAAIESEADLYDVRDELLDRFGDVPPPVANLCSVVLLKADAKRALIAHVDITQELCKLKFAPEAKMEPEPFMALLAQYKDTAAVMKDRPVILLRKKGAGIDEMMSVCRAFVQKLFICINIGL